MDDLKLKIEKFNEEVRSIPYLTQAAEAANIPPAAIVVAGLVISVILVALNFSFSGFLVQLIGVAYPAFKSV